MEVRERWSMGWNGMADGQGDRVWDEEEEEWGGEVGEGVRRAKRPAFSL